MIDHIDQQTIVISFIAVLILLSILIFKMKLYKEILFIYTILAVSIVSVLLLVFNVISGVALALLSPVYCAGDMPKHLDILVNPIITLVELMPIAVIEYLVLPEYKISEIVLMFFFGILLSNYMFMTVMNLAG